MKSIRGIRLNYFALVIGLIAFVAGIYLTFFQGSGFVKSEATIVSIEESEFSTEDNRQYDVTVRYTVDGKEYTGPLGNYSPSYKVGDSVKIKYNPENPADMHGDMPGFSIYVMVIGFVLFAGSIFFSVRSKMKQKKLAETRNDENGVTYAPSVPGPERELYFITDLGTPKYGHRIEDRSRRVLYEARMTKFTLLEPFGFDFIDHEHGSTTPHLIGHQEDTEWDSLFFDDHSTFTFDGEFIWKHLKRNGITVDSSLSRDNLLKTQFAVFRDGVQIARVQASSKYVHEEDAEEHGKLANALPAFGHYRVWTTETNLDLLFTTILAFARTDATTAEGGNRKTVWNTLNQD